VATFALIQDVVRAIRNLRSEKKVTPGARLPATIVAPDHAEILNQKKTTITTLARLDPERTSIVDSISTKPSGHIPLVISNVEVYLPLEEVIDLKEVGQRLIKELEEVENQINRLEKLLAGPFAEKAPEQVVQKERDRLARFKQTAAKLQTQLNSLSD
jgi:valyl-tRNA synthetase